MTPHSMARPLKMLHYTSGVQTMKMNEFKLPSFSLLQKITSGQIDTMKSVKLQKENRNISEDVILMLYEMFFGRNAKIISIGYSK